MLGVDAQQAKLRGYPASVSGPKSNAPPPPHAFDKRPPLCIAALVDLRHRGAHSARDVHAVGCLTHLCPRELFGRYGSAQPAQLLDTAGGDHPRYGGGARSVLAMEAHPLSHPTRMLGCMNFWPTSNDYRPCWHCTQFAGMLYAGSAAACASPSGPRVRSMPGGGCVKWEREPGTDDEPGPPDGQVVLPSTPRLPRGSQGLLPGYAA